MLTKQDETDPIKVLREVEEYLNFKIRHRQNIPYSIMQDIQESIITCLKSCGEKTKDEIEKE